MINLTINGKPVSVAESSTILEAAKQNNIYIPNLCYLEGVHQFGSCRLCVVEVEGARNLQASCMVPVREGMVIKTNTEKVRKARKVLYELLLSDHPKDCLSCERNQSCELQEIGNRLGVTEARFEGERSKGFEDFSPSITRDMSKCILCRRCITVCKEIQNVGILNAQNRGFKTVVGPAMDLPINSVNCAYCGQCTVVCPVGALKETDAIQSVWKAINDKKKRVVVQVAPAIRAAIGEEFGLAPGTLVTGKLVTALREMGFDDVFDTNFAADLTIMEEGTELLTRVKKALTGGEATLPMVTSCSPGWIKYVEHAFPQELDHLSTCKSPHTMLGALAKSYYAEKIKVDPKDMVVVSIMPCTAKKFEISRPEMKNNGVPNVDAVLTTRELAKMIKEAGIDFVNLADSQFDNPLGLSSGAADIFGVTGGVMEAALRTVYELVTGRELPFEKLHVTPIVGLEQIKTADILIEDPLEDYKFLDGFTVKIAVTSGLKGAKILLDQIAKGESPYHFIEVMGCSGGCIGGGGQPRPTTPEIRKKRMAAIYQEDEGKALRKSHENEYINKLYQEYLVAPNGHKSHDLLHTHYTKRGKFNEYLNKE
ncbi:MAG TPA: NADH-dependent [FeFe] hydrogenase, group A6 [Methylomusa anaerophila]|uniref:NADP-reducing hydrogenase subunit HndC n=1 Tax=Methylomusa anaerophila TaxID=1930071 RepID=A0A348AGU4_9FIRM|nr:NADH-dependent [FeFe] hydrogenase, group A6 [Methylomusa anaerophila]BBB90292.1 NADP-reducing hydrogenase subunit HndC [Methylomusa anaerophila]HML89363.1 NADH-dependent [FeFe] hydrogenase, group A6 [Methylomusa anaerophila]